MATTFNWYEEKAALKATLNSCIRQGFTYKQTEIALRAQFAGSCTTCIIATLGQCVCDKGRNCFIEQSLKTYLAIAKEKCLN